MSRRLDCAVVRDHLPAYALDDLDGDEQRMVRDHVLCCPSCARESRGFDRTLGWLDEIDAPTAALEPIRPRVSRRRPWLIAALVAAVVVMILIVGHRSSRASESHLAMAGDGEAVVAAHSEATLEAVDRVRLLRGEVLLRAGATPLFANVGDDLFEVESQGALKLTWRDAAGRVAVAAVAGVVFVVSPGGAREMLRAGSTMERDAKRREEGKSAPRAAASSDSN
ncbi:MAG: zf-HC2 domain-containing protein [Planctomycetes bacterium]|nr:zf-HC2 domain-containing protein [Planctomycetota bacterium]